MLVRYQTLIYLLSISTYNYSSYHLEKHKYLALSTTANIFNFNFYNIPGNESVDIEFDIIESGTCHAVVYWYELQLDQDTVISTAPHLPQLSCWKQAFQIFGEPQVLTKGKTFKLVAHHDDEALWFTVDK